MSFSAQFLSRAGLIAALYVVLTVTPPLNVISYGPIQVRISEALTVLAYFEPAAIIGLWIGAVIANYFGPIGFWDVFLGAGLTLIAAYLTWKIRRPVFALLPPVLLNGLGISFMLKYIVAATNASYFFLVFSITGGEAVAVYIIGYPLLMFLLNTNIFIREEILVRKLRRR